ncbi:MAG: carbohydrate kinase family protein [Zoogloeaceae bacterium]|jgi:adenosine kinase|nr:carbohydrate kinase family protein [Zoogloeaceae bacterium]
MSHALICGSLAYDNIMVFPDRFKQHILPEQIHILNVSFLVPELRREFGGCAGNIAYNLKLLGGEPLIMATVGDDFAPYRQHLEACGLALTHVRQVPGTFTAQAFITTDLDDNQITAFHPGAMNCSQQNRVEHAENILLGLVGPDGRAGMLQHAQDFAALHIPFIFDPGQGLPLFSGEELLQFLALADYACFNDYEAQLTVERSGKSIEALAQQVRALIVTSGAQGSRIHLPGRTLEIPCAKANALIDPTGCGDAYRAGILYGILNHLDWEETGRLASLMGALKIENQGAQNHHPTRAEICARYQQSFGTTIRL